MKAAATKITESDRRILLIYILLTSIGLWIVASSSSFFSAARFSDPYFLMKKHILRMSVALIFFFIAAKIDYRIYRKTAWAFYLAVVLLLVGLFVAGHPIRGRIKSFYIEPLHATFQPSEAARLALIFFIAFWITRTGKDFEDFKRGFVPAALTSFLIIGLVAAQPNFGMAVSIGLVAMVMMFAGGARVRHMALLAVATALPVLIGILSKDYARMRIMAFLRQGDGIREANWQIHQSLIGLGSGGLFGTGFGESMQKLNWLPDSHTDFVFSILGEEAGFIGTLVVSGLFLLIALRALKISRRCGDTFGEMLAIGIGSSIFISAALNMGVATGILPVTGLPLPFISYGGTSLLVNSVSVGILLNIAGRIHKKKQRERIIRVLGAID